MERIKFKILLYFLFVICSTSLYSETCDYTAVKDEVLYITNDNNTLYVSVRDKGILKSTNGGTCWTNEGLSKLNVYSIITHKGIMYAATSDGTYKKVSDVWQKNAFSDTTVSHIIGNSRVLIAITYNGMYRSTNEGNNWNTMEQWVGANSESKIIALNDKLYACSNKGTYCSSDDGISWQKLGVLEKNITCLWYDSGLLYAGTTFEGIYAFDFNIQQWNLISPELCDINSILVKGDTILIGGIGCGARISCDKGKTWVTGKAGQFGIVYTVRSVNNTFFVGSTTGLHIYDFGKKQFIPFYERNGDIVYLASAGNTLFLVQGDESFRSSDCNFPSELMSVSINPQNSLSGKELKTITTHNNTIFACTDSSIIKSDDGGVSWTKQGDVRSPIVGIIVAKDVLYIYTGSGLYISKDWGVKNEIIPFFSLDNNPLEIESNDTVIIVRTSKGIYTSYDKGETWQIEPELQSCNSMVLKGNALFMSDGNFIIRYNIVTKEKKFLSLNYIMINSKLFIVGELLFVAGSGIRYSIDNGETWSSVNLSGTEQASQTPSMITQCDEYVYFAFGKTLLRKNIAEFGVSKVESENQFIRDIVLSPNPTSNEISIYSAYTYTVPLPFSIINSVGETVLSGTIPADSEHYTMPIHNLSAGMYIFSAEVNGKRIQEKFVVMR